MIALFIAAMSFAQGQLPYKSASAKANLKTFASQKSNATATASAVRATRDRVNILEEGFELSTSGWTVSDQDGDGYNWVIWTNEEVAHTGSSSMASASYDNDNDAALTPNNWLISPAIDLRAQSGSIKATFWVKGMDDDYPNEHYKVCVSTSANVASFSTTLYEETIPSSGWFERTVDLSTYAGQTIYIAFVHCNVTDMYYLVLDDISVYVDNNDDVDDNCAVCSSGQILCYSVMSDNTAKVTGGSNLSGNLIIPSSVTLNGRTYPVTRIGEAAFEECSRLTSVTIPNSVTEIGERAFASCTALIGTLVIPNSVTKIGRYAFRFCTGITELTIGESVDSIGNEAFSCCRGLTTVNFNPTNCTYMGGVSVTSFIRVFYECTSLTTLNIGANVTNIPYYAFENCSTLTGTLVIPNAVRKIEKGAFRDCSGLTGLTIGESLDTIKTNAFSGCSSLATINYNARNCVFEDSNGISGNSHITTVNIGNNVVRIPSGAFENCIGISGTLTIPNSVTSIGDRAFSHCYNISSLRLGSGISTIESFAFNCINYSTYTTGLQSVYYAGTLEQWCEITFGGDDPLDRETNPLYCAHNLYINNELIRNLVIPNTITNIKTDAFIGASITSVTFHNSVTSIGAYAFSGCSLITELTIPESVTSIGSGAFSYCDGLTTVNFNATNCTSGGFQGCSSLTTLNIGENVTNIPASAFEECSGLTGTLIIPNAVTNIGNYAFYYCSGITSLIIGNSVTDIGGSAFMGCINLTELTIGESVGRIGTYAFAQCHNLTITSLAENPPTIFESTFTDSDHDVLVPCGTVEAYNNAEYWRNITNIHQDPDCPTGIEESEIADIELYPTTVTDILNITSSETISEIEIVNVMGQVVRRVKVNCDNATCNVEDLTKGVYFVRIYGNKASAPLSQQKFIKE